MKPAVSAQIQTISFLLLIFTIISSSCSVDKRLYRRGYYIETSSARSTKAVQLKENATPQALKEIQVHNETKMTVIKVDTTATDTSNEIGQQELRKPRAHFSPDTTIEANSNTFKKFISKTTSPLHRKKSKPWLAMGFGLFLFSLGMFAVAIGTELGIFAILAAIALVTSFIVAIIAAMHHKKQPNSKNKGTFVALSILLIILSGLASLIAYVVILSMYNG